VQIVRTARLVATSWLDSDADQLFVVHSDVETMRFVRQGRPETREETASLVAQYIAEDAAVGFTKWRVADLADRLVGRAGFGPHGGGRELGYTIRRDLWGQGLATEIGSALVSWHVAHAADIPLYAYVAVENPASRRVLEKIGFDAVGPEDHHGVPCELFSLRPRRPGIATGDRRQPSV
jgi:RimJ/RimL family protein N-acetyltransferase